MMKKTLMIALLAVFAMALCSCNNKKTKCNDCDLLGVSLPDFEKKFEEKKVTLYADDYQKEKVFEMAFSSMEEAEYKIATCILNCGSFNLSGCELMELVIKAEASSFTYPFDTLLKADNFTIVDSDDGKVRCYGWRNVNATRFMNPILMVQYKVSGGGVCALDLFEFEKADFGSEDLCCIYPEKVFRFENDGEEYTMIWGVYGVERDGTAYYGLVTLKTDDEGVKPVQLFYDGELKECVDVSFCQEAWFDEYEGDFSDLVYFNEDEKAFYFPEIKLVEKDMGENVPDCEKILTDRYVKYVWDGSTFSLQKGEFGVPGE